MSMVARAAAAAEDTSRSIIDRFDTLHRTL